MKRIIASTIMLIALTYTIQAHPQDANNLPQVTTTGEAEVRVVPDEVILSFGIETTDPRLEQSKLQNDQRAKKVMAVAEQLGVETKFIQTDYITVEPWFRGGQERPETLEYRVRKTMAITLKDTTKFETLMSQALEGGATHIHGVQFRTTELRKHRDAARALAIKAAREKAIALSSELGQKVGKAYRITEYGAGWYSPYGMWWGSHGYSRGMTQNSIQSGGEPGRVDGTIALGQIAISANVSVTFMLE